MIQRVGKQTLCLTDKPVIIGYGSVAGKKESEGPLKNHFDKIFYDTLLGCDTWEQAESMLQQEAVSFALEKANAKAKDVNMVFAGDLLNQCISSSYSMRGLNIPFLGQYGACSTMAQTLLMASVMVEGGAAEKALAVTSSHFCSAERQFRYPLEYGGQRTPTAQWTVTGSGAVVVAKNGNGPKVNMVTIGKIVDLGIKDINNMGAAMAPAAADTLKTFFEDTSTKPSDYDLILTGDLGHVGSDLLYELLDKEKIDIRNRHNDCGLMIYKIDEQDVHAGGSGCGCSGSVLCSVILNSMAQKKYNNILFMATGALMSPTSNQQGESIPGIAHLVNIKNEV